MSQESGTANFPKSARLLKPADFRFRSYQRFHSPFFKFLYSTEESDRRLDGARMGISISKKVLRRAIARNRVKRLLKETFRHNRSALNNSDVHVIGLSGLDQAWRELSRADVESIFQELRGRISAKP